MSESRYLRLIDCLIAHDVRFVIVGGMAAVLQRAPILTEDLEIKRALPRPKDKLMLIHLEATLEEREKLKPGGQ